MRKRDITSCHQARARLHYFFHNLGNSPLLSERFLEVMQGLAAWHGALAGKTIA